MRGASKLFGLALACALWPLRGPLTGHTIMQGACRDKKKQNKGEWKRCSDGDAKTWPVQTICNKLPLAPIS